MEVERVSLYQILEQAEKLSAEDKATLVNKLLAGSGLEVVLGNYLSGSVIVHQINMMGREELGDVLKAIADQKIASRGEIVLGDN